MTAHDETAAHDAAAEHAARAADQAVADARGHDAATVFEASAHSRACAPSLRPAWPGAAVSGPAFTVQGRGGDNLALHHAVLRAPAGSVLVIDVQGAEHGHWGEVLAVAARARGITGLVIDGGVRDTVAMGRMGFPVFSSSITVVGTRKDFFGEFGEAVEVGGAPVRAGDLVVADADGVVIVPAAHVCDALDSADARVAKEEEFMERLRDGETTVDLLDLRRNTIDPTTSTDPTEEHHA